MSTDQAPTSSNGDQTKATPFTASQALSGNLQAVLVDLLDLQLQAKQAHWNVIGPGFRSVHLQLDEIVDAAREHGDLVAERMRALRGIPDGRGGTVVRDTTLQSYPLGEIHVDQTIDLMTERLAAVIATARGVHESVDAEDAPSADELNAVITDLERLSWMLRAEGH